MITSSRVDRLLRARTPLVLVSQGLLPGYVTDQAGLTGRKPSTASAGW
jgi:hypothetical protein